MLNCGANKMKALYLGDTQIQKAYLDEKMVFENASRLPNGYTELEYIQTDNNWGINTEFDPHLSKTRIIMDIEPGNYVSGSERFFCAGTIGKMCYVYRGSNTKFAYKFGSGSEASKTINTANIRAILDYEPSQKTLSFGEAVYTITAYDTRTNSFLYLGYNYKNGAIPTKLYHAQISEDGQLLRDFVPCIDPSSNVGLFDLVNRKFYQNSLAGIFTPGPSV